MGTSTPATLRAIAAARSAESLAHLMEQTLAEAKRGADLSQTLVDQLNPQEATP